MSKGFESLKVHVMNTYGYGNWKERPVETITIVEKFVYDKKGNVVEKIVTTTKTTTYDWKYDYQPYTIPVIYSGGSLTTTGKTQFITYN